MIFPLKFSTGVEILTLLKRSTLLKAFFNNLFEIRFNNCALWCLLQPCTGKSSFPPHNPVHSLNFHLHCLQIWKTMALCIFLNLSSFGLTYCAKHSCAKNLKGFFLLCVYICMCVCVCVASKETTRTNQ